MTSSSQSRGYRPRPWQWEDRGRAGGNGAGGEQVVPGWSWGRRHWGVPVGGASVATLFTCSPGAGKKELKSRKRNQQQRTPISSVPEPRESSPSRPPTCERPPTISLRRSREASRRINLSVATRGKARGQASKTPGLPPSTWWVSPSLVAGGVSSACLLPSAPRLGLARASR